MREYTKNLNLILPTKEEAYDIGDFNSNTEKLDNAILERVHPVGSIYMSINPVSPKNLFGGEWEAFGQGTLIGGISSTSPFDETAGTIIGSNDSIVPYHNHTQSVHTHIPTQGTFLLSGTSSTGSYPVPTASRPSQWYTSGLNSVAPVINYAGTSDNTTNANIPLTTLVYMWKRIS